jgi:hypothetical protein
VQDNLQAENGDVRPTPLIGGCPSNPPASTTLGTEATVLVRLYSKMLLFAAILSFKRNSLFSNLALLMGHSSLWVDWR